jgi:hypothetical protein
MKVIVSDYSGFYEHIYTKETVCMLFIKIKYHFFKKGYKVWGKDPNVDFEKYVKGSDQITSWSPYDNFR